MFSMSRRWTGSSSTIKTRSVIASPTRATRVCRIGAFSSTCVNGLLPKQDRKARSAAHSVARHNGGGGWITSRVFCRLGALADSIELETTTVVDERQQIGRRIVGLVLGEQHIDVVEAVLPILPIRRRLVVLSGRGDEQLLDRGWRSVFGVDLIPITRPDVQDLFAADGERGGDERRSLDHRQAGGMDETEVAHVVSPRLIGIRDQYR